MLAFIHVAKTGGASVETMLESSYGFRHVPALLKAASTNQDDSSGPFVVPKYTPDDYRALKKRCPFMKSVGGHNIALWSNLHEVEPVRYLALVRDPIKRGISHYQYHLWHDDPDKTWEKWVEYPVHHNHQVKMFSRHVDPADAIAEIEKHQVFVGLTDKFDETMVMFRNMVCPDLNIAYTRSNTAKGKEIGKAILEDPVKMEQLREMYREEFPLVEWVRNEYFPRLVKEYGPTLEKDVEEFRKVRNRVNKSNILANRFYRKLFIR